MMALVLKNWGVHWSSVAPFPPFAAILYPLASHSWLLKLENRLLCCTPQLPVCVRYWGTHWRSSPLFKPFALILSPLATRDSWSWKRERHNQIKRRPWCWESEGYTALITTLSSSHFALILYPLATLPLILYPLWLLKLEKRMFYCTAQLTTWVIKIMRGTLSDAVWSSVAHRIYWS